MRKQLTAEQKLRKLIREELDKPFEEKHIRIKDGWTDSIYVDEHWKYPGKFRCNPGGGIAISILDLIDRDKLFSTPEQAEQYGMQIIKSWKQFLDKNYIGARRS